MTIHTQEVAVCDSCGMSASNDRPMGITLNALDLAFHYDGPPTHYVIIDSGGEFRPRLDEPHLQPRLP